MGGFSEDVRQRVEIEDYHGFSYNSRSVERDLNVENRLLI